MTETSTRQAGRRRFWGAMMMALLCGISAILSQGEVFRVAFIVLGVVALAGGTVTLITGRGALATSEPKKSS